MSDGSNLLLAQFVNQSISTLSIYLVIMATPSEIAMTCSVVANKTQTP